MVPIEEVWYPFALLSACARHNFLNKACELKGAVPMNWKNSFQLWTSNTIAQAICS